MTGRRPWRGQVLPPLVAIAVLVAVWDVAVRLTGVSPVLLPPPARVASSLVKHAGQIAGHSLLTFFEALGGFLLATGGGVVSAVIFVMSPTLSRAMYPILVGVKMIPLIALAPLIVVWFGTGHASKVVMAALVAFFPILVNALKGLREVGQEFHEVFETLNASRWQVLWKLRLPSALGYIFAALRVAAVFAVIGAVVAEFIGASAGIGYFVKAASYYAATDRMLAGIVATAAVGGALYGGVLAVEQVSPRWKWLISSKTPI